MFNGLWNITQLSSFFFWEKVTFKNAPVILYIHVVGKYIMNYSCETVNGYFSLDYNKNL